MMISQLWLGMFLPHLFLQVLHLAFTILQFYNEQLVKRNVSSWRNTDVYFIPTLLYCTSLSLEWVFWCPLNATLHRSSCFLLWEHTWHSELSKTVRMAHWTVFFFKISLQLWVLDTFICYVIEIPSETCCHCNLKGLIYVFFLLLRITGMFFLHWSLISLTMYQ